MQAYLISPERKRSKLMYTRDHPASHYGIGVLLIPRSCAAYRMIGDMLDGYRLNTVLAPLGWRLETDNIRLAHNALGIPEGNPHIGSIDPVAAAASKLGRKGGSVRSEAKTQANKHKGQGRPPGSGSLTALQREAYELRQQGLSIREIAQRMGRNPENVRQFVSRAATKLGIPGSWMAVGKKEKTNEN
jgi:DNA-binding CsgD family transcriptional regulator